jgi:ribosomal protein L21E
MFPEIGTEVMIDSPNSMYDGWVGKVREIRHHYYSVVVDFPEADKEWNKSVPFHPSEIFTA